MAQASTAMSTTRCAVITGANKGIGFEICRQLASNEITVILTARDVNKGLEAIKKLQDSGISDRFLVFHQLDVLDPNSIASLADFVKTRFGKLDILVNNAGTIGILLDPISLSRAIELHGCWPDDNKTNWDEIASQNFDMVKDCVKTNYYGTKRMVEAFAPLLQLSDSPRIVNVSSLAGLLENVPTEWAKGLLSDVERLAEETIDEVLDRYLKDFKDGSIESKGWRDYFSTYSITKAAINAYTRIIAKKYPSFGVNSVCPGTCRTDIIANAIGITAAEGAEFVVRVALLPKDDVPSGCFFSQNQMVDF